MLTREQILSMEPGRELDCAISLKIFGTKEITIIGKYYWIDEPLGKQVPLYSTDISAAWKVVEKWNIVHIEYVEWFECNKSTHVKISVPNGDDFDVYEATGKTAPEAICKAALLATLEVES